MLSSESLISVIKFENAINNYIPGMKGSSSNEVGVKIRRVRDSNGNWHFKTEDIVSKEVKQGLASVVESLKKQKLNEDVFQQINK